jgi:RNA-directed DNA polymerase
VKDSRAPFNPEKQEAIDLHGSIGASGRNPHDWDAINWPRIEKDVRRLQRRIAQAVKANQWGKVKTLGRILTRSRPARLLAVRRVTTNKGSRTPGVDNVLWKTPRAKWQAAQDLGRRGYKAQPLRRVYIAKRNGKLRPQGSGHAGPARIGFGANR